MREAIPWGQVRRLLRHSRKSDEQADRQNRHGRAEGSWSSKPDGQEVSNPGRDQPYRQTASTQQGR